MIIQNIGQDGLIDLTFTVHKTDMTKTLDILDKKVKAHVNAREIYRTMKLQNYL